VSTPPQTRAFVEKERRLSSRVAIAAGLAAVLFFAAQFAASAALPDLDADSAADVLTAYADSPGDSLYIPAGLRGLSVLLMSIPLAFLFRAAMNRSDRMRREWIGFCFLGPVVIALHFMLAASALDSVSGDFVEREDELVAAERQAATEDSGAEGSGAEGSGETGTEGAQTEDGETDEEDSAREDAAENLLDDADSLATAQLVGVPGYIAFGIAFIYTGLWAMRTGLLTRFSGSAAMAIGILLALVIFVLAQIGVFGAVVWMVFLGIFFARPAERRPPAWEAGEPIPWPKPGEEPPEPPEPEGPAGTVEGEGRPLPGPEAGDGSPDGAPRKRKRRR